jgi:Uma2 family endonuclease
VPVSEETYLELVLEDPEGHWELECGRLRSKPGMTIPHNQIAWVLGHRLQSQLDLREFQVRVDAGRLRRTGANYYEPDVIVIPIALIEARWAEAPTAAEAYSEPLPLVVEVWSPKTGEYDVDTKLPEYQRRGDWEIWRIHPYEKTLTAWQRQPDGSYTETLTRGGIVRPATLPDVSIDLDALFDLVIGA